MEERRKGYIELQETIQRVDDDLTGRLNRVDEDLRYAITSTTKLEGTVTGMGSKISDLVDSINNLVKELAVNNIQHTNMERRVTSIELNLVSKETIYGTVEKVDVLVTDSKGLNVSIESLATAVSELRSLMIKVGFITIVTMLGIIGWFANHFLG